MSETTNEIEKMESIGTVCTKCGTQLTEGQMYCPTCGQKVDVALDTSSNAAIEQFNATVNKKSTDKKAFVKIVIGAVIVIAALIVLATKVFVSVETLCAQGKYEKAYEKANGSEKNAVLGENIIAYLSEESSSMLKDPSSFVLRDAYYNVSYNKGEDRIYQQAVLHINGTNSYGASVSNYCVWTADEYGEWDLLGTCSSLSQDEDDDDYIESLIAVVIIGADDTEELSKTVVRSINSKLEADTLYQVELIDYDDIDISVLPLDGDE